MAKLGLLFIAVFCVVQLSLASRIPREADVESTTALLDSLKGKFEDGIKTIQQEVSNTFTKENADKIWDNIQEAGSKLTDLGKELSQNVQDKYTELTKDAEKKD